MSTLIASPSFVTTSPALSAHIASQCRAILARLDSEGLGLRDDDEVVYTPPAQLPWGNHTPPPADRRPKWQDDLAEIMPALAPAQGYAALLDAAGEDEAWVDDMLASPVGARTEAELQAARVAAAIVPPWPVRPAYAHLLPAWQELRKQQVMRQLKYSEARSMHDMGVNLGGDAYWLALPRLRTVFVDGSMMSYSKERLIRKAVRSFEVVTDARPLPPYKWKERGLQWRSQGEGWVEVEWCGPPPFRTRQAPRLAHIVDAFNRKNGLSARKAPAKKKTTCHTHNRGCYCEADGSAADGRPSEQPGGPQGHVTTAPLAHSCEQPGGLVAPQPAALAPSSSSPDYVCDSPKKKRGDFSPTLEVDLPVSLLGHRAEIGDQGCYLLHLLYRPNNKPLKAKHLKAEDGWRALQSVELNPYLGQCRVEGKQTYRLSLLLGTREKPGLLERLGLVERDPTYSAGHYCMHWRLTNRDRTGATERVRLVIKPQAADRSKEGQGSGPPVHDWTRSSYRTLGLDHYALLVELCERAGVPYSPRCDEVSVSLSDSAKTKGKPRKKQPGQEDWQLRLSQVRAWESPLAASREAEDLRRAATTGRLTTAFSNLPSWLRKHATLGGQPVVELDVRAAMLTFSAARMRAAGQDSDPDVAAVCDLIEDPEHDPYGALFAMLHGREMLPSERDAFKDRCYTDLLYGKPYILEISDLGKAVAARFPGWFAILHAEKTAKGASEFANSAYRHEASIMLESLFEALSLAVLPAVPCHDAIYVKVADRERAAGIMAGVLAAAGVRAVIR